MTQSRSQKFWDRFAERYAARPIKDIAAYEAMLADVASRLRPSDHVLEIGCGTGGTAIRLAPLVAQWTATDLSPEMVRIARSKPAGANLRFVVSEAGTAFDSGPVDVICAFNILHLVHDLPDTLSRIHAELRPGGLLISKTWCFADLPLQVRLLFPILRAIGLFPVATSLSTTHLRQAILDAGFQLADERVFGQNPQNRYIVARKPIASADDRPAARAP